MRNLATRADDFTHGLQQTLKASYVGSDTSNINDTFAKFIAVNLDLQQILQTKGSIARAYPVLRLGPAVVGALRDLNNSFDVSY